MVIVAALGIPLQCRIRQVQSQQLDLRHGGIDEFLAQIVVADPLDAPLHGLRRVNRGAVAGSEHHDHRPPPAIQGFLRHGLLLGSAAAQRQHDVEALTLMKRLFLADPDHRARVRSVRATAQRDLIHDGGAIDQPADGTDICPCRRRVVEDARILCLAAEQGIDHLLARGTQGFGGGVQIQAVPALILNFRQEDGLAFETGRSGDPVAFGQHAHHFRVRVLRNLPHQSPAVGSRHPVLRLDLLVGLQLRVEPGLIGRVLVCAARGLLRLAGRQVHRLGVHAASLHRLNPPSLLADRSVGQFIPLDRPPSLIGVRPQLTKEAPSDDLSRPDAPRVHFRPSSLSPGRRLPRQAQSARS